MMRLSLLSRFSLNTVRFGNFMKPDTRTGGRPMYKMNALESESDIFTCQDIDDASRRCGMEISLSTLGPFYRVVMRLAEGDTENKKGKIIGYTTGSIFSPLLRQDTMLIYGVNSGNMMSKASPEKKERGWSSPSTLGLSLLLGAYAGRYAFDQGCVKAELLAINDDERQHAILRRHYQRLGLKPVRQVTEDLASIPGEPPPRCHISHAPSLLTAWDESLPREQTAWCGAASGRSWRRTSRR
jgi:hypothetical protein